MAARGDGTLSSTEFYLAASAFSDQWRKFNASSSQWKWVPCHRRPLTSINQEEGYLSSENVVLPTSIEEVRCEDDVGENDECSCSEDCFIDDAVLIQNGDSMRRQRLYDLHIVYSASYMVPVLFFRGYYSDGQPLLLDDIRKDLSANMTELLTESQWTFITQEEHPLLNRPWFTLHPCGTSDWMKLLRNHDNYLTSWFSLVGQVFGLKLPLEMLK